MKKNEAIEHQWPYLLSFLPKSDVLEVLAFQTGALVRRRRVDSVSTLLRLALIYGFCGYSLRQTAAWAQSIDLVDVSDVALLKRFRRSADFMCQLVAKVLAAQAHIPNEVSPHLSRIRLVDGTTISEPGSAGVDWRLHLGFDLRTHRMRSLELTDASVGESLLRFKPLAGELLIADRGYARANGIRWVLQHSAHVLVRLPWNNINFDTAEGKPLDLFAWLGTVPEATPVEIGVRLRGGSPPLRLLALRKTEAATEKSRAKIFTHASNHSKMTDPRTLEAAAFTLLLTDQSAGELSADAAFDLYRFRWQIELCFKQLKSIVGLGQLPAKDPDLARMILASKLLGALLIDQLCKKYVSFSPWGFSLAEPTHLPLASI